MQTTIKSQDFNCKRHKYTENKGCFLFFFLMFVIISNFIYIFINFFLLFIYYLGMLTITSSTLSDMFLVDFQNLLCLRKHENIQLWCFYIYIYIYIYILYIYDFIELVLHQTQCNFRQSRSGSNSAFSRLGKRFADSLPHSWNQPDTSKSLRTRNNPESHSNRAEAPKLRRIRSPRSFRHWRRFTELKW